MSTPPLPRLSDDARDVLDVYRRAAPGDARRRANLDAVRGRVEREAPPTRAAAAGLLWSVGWGTASAVVAAGLVWGVVEVRSPSTPPTAPEPAQTAEPLASGSTPAPTQPVVAPPQPRLEALSLPAPAPAQRPRSRSSEPAAAPQRTSDLEAETNLLRSIRASIGAGRLEDAARALEQHGVEFPAGALREDADAYRVIVACKRGEDASAARRAFGRRYPGSPHRARITAVCDAEKE